MKLRFFAALVIVASAVAVAACDDAGSTGVDDTLPSPASLMDPAQPGPYAVGTTRLMLERPSNADGSPRVLDTVLWYPAQGPPGGNAVLDAPPIEDGAQFPIVIYSHGSGGQPDFQTFLTEHLASHGFVVAAPPHPGNTSADCALCDSSSIIPSARERPTDVTFVLDEIIALRDDPESALGRVIDPERTAIVGHSFGAWTALYVAPDGRFDVVVAHAPALPNLLTGRAADVTAPVLIIASEKDQVASIALVDEYWAALELAAAEKLYVKFPEGTHLNYIDRCLFCGELEEERGQELVRRYTTAWLHAHLLGDARYEQYLAADPPDAVIAP